MTLRTAVALLLLSSAAAAQSVIVGNGSQEKLQAGAQVYLPTEGVEVQSGGTLILSGSAATAQGVVTSLTTVGAEINVLQGGTIDLKFGKLEGIARLVVWAGAKVTRIQDTVFIDLPGMTPGQAAWIDLSGLTSADRANLPFSFNRVSFIDLQASPTRRSIKSGTGTPLVRCLGNPAVHGNRWGQIYDDDPSNAVLWHTGQIARTTPPGTFDTLEDALKDIGTTASSILTVKLGGNAFIDDIVDFNTVPGAGASPTGPSVVNACLAPMIWVAVTDNDIDTNLRGKIINCTIARGIVAETTAENCTFFDPLSTITVSLVTGKNCLVQNAAFGGGCDWTNHCVTNATSAFFTNAASYNFHLVSPGGDTAIDEGVALSTLTDVEGDLRGADGKPGGSGTWDIGSDEYLAGTPANFAGVGQSLTSITWSWTDLAAETGYELHRDDHLLVASIAMNATSYLETNLSENTAASRHFHGSFGGALGAPTATVAKYTQIHDAVTADFTLVVVSTTQIDVQVVPPPNATAGLTGCQIERQPSGGSWSTAKAFSNTYLFSDTGLSAGTVYNYRITFRNGDAVASLVSGTLTAKTTTPAIPGSFAGAPASPTSMTWSWANMADETGYQVHDGAEAIVGKTLVDVLSLLETGLLENTSYTRHVHSVNGEAKSAGSTAVAKFTAVHDPVVADFACKVISATQIDVVVTAPPNGGLGTTAVKIERKTTAGSTWTTIKNFTSGYTQSDGGLTASTSYDYKITFRNGDSALTAVSAIQAATTSAAPVPGGFAGTPLSPTSIQWSWNDVNGESSYVVHDGGEVQKGTTAAQVTTLVESTGLSENAPFTRHVHAVNGVGTSAGSTAATVYTRVHDPLETDFTPLFVSQTSVEITVTQPPNPSTLQTACEIQRSLDYATWTTPKAFSNSYLFTDTIPSGASPRYRIRYRNADGVVGPESPSKVVSMTPVLVAPVPASATTDTTPDFDWTDIPGKAALTYDLQVDNNSDFSSPEINQTGLATSAYTPGAALTAGLYYWRVRAKCNGANFGPYSAVGTVTIDTTAPAAPTLLAPANSSFVGVSTPTFGWSVVTDPSGVTYQLQVATDVGFVSIVSDISNIGAASYKLPTSLTGGTTYYWRVRAKDGAGTNGSYSSNFSFTVDLTAPAAVTLTSPADAATVSTGTPTFQWSSVSDPSGVTYRLQIDTEQSFAIPLYVDKSGIAGTSYAPPFPLADGAYVWRVLAVDGAGNASLSATWRVTVDTTSSPSSPTINLDVARKTTTQKPQIRGKSAESAGTTIKVYFDGIQAGTTTVDGTGSWTYNPGANQSFGAHTVYATASKAGFPDSPASNAAAITIDQTVTPASNLTVTPINGQILLTWAASPDPDVIGYQVYKSISGGAFNLITGSQLVVDTRYTDGSLTNGTTYAYRVRAVDNTLQEGP